MVGDRPAPVMVAPRNLKRKDMVSGARFSFEDPPEPIAEDSIVERVEADLVVVGGGIAGSSAALAAAEAGAKVVLLEKTALCHGFGGMNAFLGGRVHERLGIEIDKQEVVGQLVRFGQDKPNAALINVWAYGSAETADWMADHVEADGLVVELFQYPPPPGFNDSAEAFPSYLTGHFVLGSEQAIVNCYVAHAVAKGAEVRCKMRGRRLIKSDAGRVEGVIAQDEGGAYHAFVGRRGVILCTGDYGRNSEMVAKYCPQVGEMQTSRAVATGDGHQMALWAGAQMEPMPHATMTHALPGVLGITPFLQVNSRGERFHNEDVPMEYQVNALMRQPNQVTWQIFDADYAQVCPRMGVGLGRVNDVTDEVREFVDEHAIKADSIEDLAAKIRVPYEKLKGTIDRYSELARLGRDLDFGKRADRLSTVEVPPFYASQGSPWFLCAMGGLNVSTRLEAVDKDGAPIPGLYMAGNIMGNRFGMEYPSMLPGLSNGMAMHYGRVAGLTAQLGWST